MTEIEVYRIGGGPKHAAHWAHYWHVDRWFRSWQAEWDGARRCPRSWTRRMVERKARRWMRSGADVRKQSRRYKARAVST